MFVMFDYSSLPCLNAKKIRLGKHNFFFLKNWAMDWALKWHGWMGPARSDREGLGVKEKPVY